MSYIGALGNYNYIESDSFDTSNYINENIFITSTDNFKGFCNSTTSIAMCVQILHPISNYGTTVVTWNILNN